jgi:hypothetical protein
MHERTKMTEERRERERDPFDEIKVFFNETKSTSRGGTKNARVGERRGQSRVAEGGEDRKVGIRVSF